jgi:uncharacterized protein
LKLRIKVQPRARRTRLAGKVGEEWKLEITAPPVEGKANRAVIEFFAGYFGVSKAAVRIVSGERSPHKVIEIAGARDSDIAKLQTTTGD